MSIAEAVAEPIGDVGSRFMRDPATFAHGAEIGFDPGYAYYLAGRLGVLGDVDSDVVVAAATFIEPTMLRTSWEQARAIAEPRTVAAHYADGCTRWADEHLAGVDDLGIVRELGGRVVSAASSAAAPIFAGWRAFGIPSGQVAGGYRVLHLLRELRFARHAVAALAGGLTPVECIVAGPAGPGGAAMFGWVEPHPEVSDELRDRRRQVESVTDRLSERDFSVLDDDEGVQFVAAVDKVRAALG